jgi:hypothetical protein
MHYPCHIPDQIKSGEFADKNYLKLDEWNWENIFGNYVSRTKRQK